MTNKTEPNRSVLFFAEDRFISQLPSKNSDGIMDIQNCIRLDVDLHIAKVLNRTFITDRITSVYAETCQFSFIRNNEN